MNRLREAVVAMACAASCGTFAPSGRVFAQSFEWSAAPAVLIDPHILAGTRVGPAFAASVLRVGGGNLSYGLFLSAGRIDLKAGLSEFHTYHATGALGVRLMTSSTGKAVGVVFGAGARVQDEVNETSPVRSSARWQGLLMPGLEAQWPAGTSAGVTLFVRDYVTGVPNALLDPAEADIRHLIIVGAGIHFRHD